MRRILLYVSLLVSLFALCGNPSPARAEPDFVQIDGSDKQFSAKDFGYEIKLTATGDRCYVSIKLDKKAAKSFTGASLSLYQGGNLLVDTRLGLVRDDSGKTHQLFVAVDPRVMTGGDIFIQSNPIKGRPLVKNFAGFQLSVANLLKQAYPGTTLEEIRKVTPTPNKNDSTKQLLEFLKSKDAFIRAAAIDLLGERKAKEAIPHLIDLVTDGTALVGSDNFVGSHAATALSRITGRPFSTDRNEWLKWWKEQKLNPK